MGGLHLLSRLAKDYPPNLPNTLQLEVSNWRCYQFLSKQLDTPAKLAFDAIDLKLLRQLQSDGSPI